MIKEKLILTPYIFKKKIDNKEFIGNLLSNNCFIENTEAIENIINYFTELKNVPYEFNDHFKLIEKLLEMRILVSEKSLLLPIPNIELEITNMCNASCIMCPRSKITREKGFMKDETFNMVIDRLREVNVNEVEICGVGEPLLNNNVAEYIRRLKSIGIKKVKMVTNASLLTKQKAKEIVESGLDSIMISFHTIDPNNYATMMKGLDYHEVLNNIKYFVDTYKDKVDIIITCVVSEKNKNEIKDFKKFWKDKSVENIYFQNVQSRAGNLCIPKELTKKSRCPVMEQGLFISVEGKYLSCSNDFSGESSWSDINEMGLEECLKYKLNIIRHQELFEFCQFCDYDFHDERYLNTSFYKHVNYEGVKE